MQQRRAGLARRRAAARILNHVRALAAGEIDALLSDNPGDVAQLAGLLRVG
jgi:hypothetical protein